MADDRLEPLDRGERYRPRTDCTDVPADSDDRWCTLDELKDVVRRRVREREQHTAGFAEVPLDPSRRLIDTYVAALVEPLDRLGRRAVSPEGVVVYHWTVPEYVAAAIEFDFWKECLRLRLGEWD